MLKKVAGFSFLFLLFLFNGCESNSNQNNNAVPDNQEILVIDDKWLNEKIRNRNDKILFINVWATWCQPCVEEFPDLVQIHNEYKDSGFEFLSVSVDLISEIDSKVKPFLKEQNAVFQTVIADEKKAENIINLLNEDWSGAIPATIIYDKKGNQKSFIIGAHSFESFKRSIDSIMEL